jgi:hypothetical protein
MSAQIIIVHRGISPEALQSLEYNTRRLSDFLLNHSSERGRRVSIHVTSRKAKPGEIVTRHALILMTVPASRTVTDIAREHLVTALNEHLNDLYKDLSICANVSLDLVSDIRQPHISKRTLMQNVRQRDKRTRLMQELQDYRFVNELVLQDA